MNITTRGSQSTHRGERRRGFTLIELIVVISILGILTAFTMPSLTDISPKYRLRSGARELGAQIGWTRSLAVGAEEEYALRYDLDAGNFWVVLPPGPEDDPDIDIDEREPLEKRDLPDRIRIVEVRFPGGANIDSGVADVYFDAFGNQGSHIILLENEDEVRISVKFNALIGVVDYFSEEIDFEEF